MDVEPEASCFVEYLTLRYQGSDDNRCVLGARNMPSACLLMLLLFQAERTTIGGAEFEGPFKAVGNHHRHQKMIS